MGYVFDGEVVLGKAAAKAPGRVFPRLLAVVLLAFAGFLAVPIGAVMFLSLQAGALPVFALAAAASPLALLCGWVGKLLWSTQAPSRRLVVSGVFAVLAAVVSILFVAAVCYVTVIVAISAVVAIS
jgi:hypothetical protein